MKIQRLMFKENLRAAGLVTLLGLARALLITIFLTHWWRERSVRS